MYLFFCCVTQFLYHSLQDIVCVSGSPCYGTFHLLTSLRSLEYRPASFGSHVLLANRGFVLSHLLVSWSLHCKHRMHKTYVWPVLLSITCKILLHPSHTNDCFDIGYSLPNIALHSQISENWGIVFRKIRSTPNLSDQFPYRYIHLQSYNHS